MAVRYITAIVLWVLMAAIANALPPAYPSLAITLSTPYSTKPLPKSKSEKPDIPAGIANDAETLLNAIPKLSRGKHRMITAAMASLDEGVKKSASDKSELEALVKSSEANVKDVENKAKRGLYSTEVKRYESGSGKLVGIDRVDNGARQVQLAEYQLKNRELLLQTRIAQAKAVAMEQSRVDAWRVMIPQLDDVYPSNKLAGTGLDLKIDRALNTLTVENNCGLKLTQVTFVIELLTESSAPEAVVQQVYYIPILEPKKSIWLFPISAYNVKPQKYTVKEPSLTGGLAGLFMALAPRDVVLEMNADLQSTRPIPLNRFVEFRFAAWTTEGKQAQRSLKFPERAIAYAESSLNSIYKNLANEMGKSPNKETQAKLSQAPYWDFAQQEAKRIIDYLPGTTTSARAKQVLQGPLYFFEAESKRVEKVTDNILKPGSLYVCVEIQGTTRRGSAIASSKSDSTKMALLIEGRDFDTSTILVLLFDPVDTDRWWRFHGKIVKNKDNSQSFWITWTDDLLREKDKSPGSDASLNKRNLNVSNPLNFLPSKTDKYRLAVNDSNGIGSVDISFGSDAYGRNRLVKFIPADGTLLQRSMKDVVAKANSLDASVVAQLRQAQSLSGLWKTNAPIEIMRVRNKAKLTQEGKLQLRFENWRPATREVTVVLVTDGKECRRPARLTCLPSGNVIVEIPEQITDDTVSSPLIRRKPVDINLLATDHTIQLTLNDNKIVGRFKPKNADSKLYVDLTFDSIDLKR